MKHLLFLLFGLCLAAPGFSGEQTLISGDIEHGGYGGPVFKFTQIGPNQDYGYLVGGQGGWIINHQFVLGGGGYGLSNNIPADWLPESPDLYPTFGTQYLNFGYGGLFLAYIHNSDDLVHYEVHAMIGGGGAGYRLKDQINEDDWDTDDFFIVEPGANVEFNITPFFRIAAGASYRVVQGVNAVGLTNDNLSGLSGQIMLKFGNF